MAKSATSKSRGPGRNKRSDTAEKEAASRLRSGIHAFAHLLVDDAELYGLFFEAFGHWIQLMSKDESTPKEAKIKILNLMFLSELMRNSIALFELRSRVVGETDGMAKERWIFVADIYERAREARLNGQSPKWTQWVREMPYRLASTKHQPAKLREDVRRMTKFRHALISDIFGTKDPQIVEDFITSRIFNTVRSRPGSDYSMLLASADFVALTPSLVAPGDMLP